MHGSVVGVYSFEVWAKDRSVLSVGGDKIPVGETEVHHDGFDVMTFFAADEEFDGFPSLFWRELHVVHLLGKVC